MAGRTVVSDDEDEEIEVEDEDEEYSVSASGKGGKGGSGGRRDMDDDDEEDEEEEEEGQDEYEKDGFIVDDVEEEEEEEDSDKERRRKKRKKKRESEKNFVLDEDDYELLQDNNISVNRPKPGNKFKRLKKAGRDSEGGETSGFYDEDESERDLTGGGTADEKLERTLFGDNEGMPLEDIPEDEQAVEMEEEDGDMIGEEDEMADFIVDEDEVDADGAPVKKRVKKKKGRQALGVSSSALQEAHEIFGDVDELLDMRRQELERDADSVGVKKLEDEFEPFILSERYMTPRDDAIRETDVPERIQLSEEITGVPSEDASDREDESNWIYNQLTSDNFSALYGGEHVIRQINKEDIFNVLTMLHDHKLEIPFIAMYRKELCSSLLNVDVNTDDGENEPKMKWHKLLWAVQTLDRKWLLLQKRKTSLDLYYNRRFEDEIRRIDDETRLDLSRQLFRSACDALKEAKTEREVDDVDAKFNLHFPPGEVEAEEGQFKRPMRKSHYSICGKAGLWEVANKFGYTSEQLGQILTLTKMTEMDELENRRETPEEIAGNFTCAMFANPQDVLKGARYMAAVEIGYEPIVKKHVRGIFLKNAVASTSPTAQGNSTIDPFHELAGVKWLRKKPLSEFTDSQWLLIQKGEEEKLLQVTIKLPEEIQKKLESDFLDAYLSESVSKSAKLWNEQREMILRDAIHNFILPLMEKEARSLLNVRAKSWLLMQYGEQLWSKVTVAPWKKKDAVNDSDDESELRAMACCWGSGKPATTFVMLDPAGELIDVLYAGSISIRSQGIAEQQRKKNDQQRILKFMAEHQPQVACVGAANMSCRQLKDDIYEVIFKIVEDCPRVAGPTLESISIVYGDESVPRLYENSRIASDQLPGQPGIVKRAVALARYLHNPLAMVATLCGPGREILSWKLCQLQELLSPDEQYEIVEQVMVDATNQIGFDVNLAASHEWLFSSLQFVAGLGPRKASVFQKNIVRAGSIFSRREIVEVLNGGKTVTINCVGFLRVRSSGAAAVSAHFTDVLDDTRIHPESYKLAKDLAKVVYAEDATHEINEMDEEEEEMAIEYVREKPDMLRALDIDEYANSSTDRIKKKETLCDIRMELLHGFKEWRKPYREPTADEEFWMLSGETESTIAEGRIVQVTIRNIQESRIMCTLDSGLKAVVLADNFSDDGFDMASTTLHEGDILTGKIKNVQRNRFQVYLTCKASDLKKRPFIKRESRDPYYHEEDTSFQSEQEKARKEKERAKKNFKTRMIVHPRFRNVSADEAMQELSNAETGASLIRPSSRGPSYLTLTLKIADGVYAHKEIVESGKDHKDITSLLRLGKILRIDKDTFEDLDEVMDRYVDPLVGHLKSMIAYRKFRRGTKAELDDLLRAEKARDPTRIAYCFGISHEHPGTFILAYIRSTNPHHEYIGLYPKGFRFRKRDFDNIDRLVLYFQTHINSPAPDSNMSLRNVAAMVPMKSPSAWGSGGGSGSSADGWRADPYSDRDKSSGPGGRTGGRYGGARDGHPSGIPRPGRGRGRGRNFGGDNHGSEMGQDKWGSGSNNNDDDYGKEKFSGSWGGGGGSGRAGEGTGGSRGGWSRSDSYDGGGSHEDGGGAGGWGSGSGSGGWRSDGNGGSSGAGGWGGSGDASNGPSSGGWADAAKLVSPQANSGTGWSSRSGGSSSSMGW